MLLHGPCAYPSRSMLAAYAVSKITYTVSKIQFPADGGNALDSYSRGIRFECRLRYGLSWQRFLCGFPETLQKNAGIIFWLGHDGFLPNPLQFTNLLTIRRYTVYYRRWQNRKIIHENKEIVGTSFRHQVDDKCIQKCTHYPSREGRTWQNLGIDRITLLKWIFKKYDVRIWDGLNKPKKKSSSVAKWTQ
jgi:hypothetical protein